MSPTPTAELNRSFSQPDAEPRLWSEVEAVLSASEMFWLSTVRTDGRPHVTPIPTVWHVGKLHFCVGAHEQKAKNLAADPRCVLTTGTNQLRSGLDVIVEGTAERATDHDTLVELAALWLSKLDWPFEVGENAFRDGAGRDGLVFAVSASKILAFGKEPFTQTRYRFQP